MTLWSGRFSSPMAASLWSLSESYSFDHVLYHHDIMGTKAHVAGLEHVGLLTNREALVLTSTLEQIEGEFASGEFVRSETDEDIHMAIERRATELAGETGAKIHTARSRNDQVATTLRLFARDAITEIALATLELTTALREQAAKFSNAYLPGYTHLQRAQPVLLSHHLSAHVCALLRDIDRLCDSRERLNVSPLGAGALAGTSLPIDPGYTAGLLGFREPFANSMDAVSDRDFVAETLFDIALLGVHLSRIGEELVLWTSSEFGFATLGDAFTTGSSMLPQKKNSDVAELARGKSGRLVGNLTSVLVMLKGLPLAYNRDLQEDKEPLFDSVSSALVVLAALAGAFRSMEFHEATAAAAANDDLLGAIDVAERLVVAGEPFRQAHEKVGRLVAEALSTNTPLAELAMEHGYPGTLEDYAPAASLRARQSPGASGPASRPQQELWIDAESARLHERILRR